MNFKTTLILIGLLAVAGIVLLFTREKEGAREETTKVEQQKLIDISSPDVSKLVITPADGQKRVFEKTAGKWRIVEPVAANAEAFEVDSLVRAVTEMESTSSASSSVATGLDKPRYVVEVTGSNNTTRTINIGDKTAVGDSLYVAVKDKNQPFVVSADVLTHLKKPIAEYRDPKLVETPEPAVTQVTINKPDGKLVLSRSGTDWKITEPAAMPADESETSRLVSALTSLRAAEFLSDNPAEATMYQLDPPRFSAVLSSAATTMPVGVGAPSSAPASQPAGVTINFGRYADVGKQHVIVMSSQVPAIAKVGADIIETINKKPLDLRDRKVLDIDPQQVSTIEISSDLAATTRPTSRPASKSDIKLKRRHEAAALGPAAPASKPATTQASTAPATTTAATQPATKWQLVTGGETKDAADSKIDTLLTTLHPLTVAKYHEGAPTTQPTATYVIKIITQAAAGAPEQTHELRLTDPGNSQPLLGTYNGLSFEVGRHVADRLSGSFERGAQPPPPPPGLGSDEAGFPSIGSPHGPQ